jgi:tetratricopeptide (TPR) repeat protein
LLASSNLALFYYYDGQLKEAESGFRKVLELRPDYPGTHCRLGLILLEQSNPQAALAAMQREKEAIWRDQGLALAYYAAGQKKEADKILAEYVENQQSVAAYQIAEIYAYRDEADKAFEWLERAYEQRDGGLSEMKDDPLLRNIEKDPRYIAFLKKMKLPLD